MFKGETILSGADAECCGVQLQFRVLCSGAGFYIGTQCATCGPYSRESHYFGHGPEAKAVAEYALKSDPMGLTWKRV